MLPQLEIIGASKPDKINVICFYPPATPRPMLPAASS